MSGDGMGTNTARLLAPLAGAQPLADGYAYALFPASAAAEVAAALAGGGGAGCKEVHLVRHAQGAHNLAVNSKGDLFITESYEGKRVQKFRYTGLGAASVSP